MNACAAPASDLGIGGLQAGAQAAASYRTLLLVDDHELVRYGVKTLYTELQGVSLRWLEAGTLQEALAMYARESRIDAVLLALNLSDCTASQRLRCFVQAH